MLKRVLLAGALLVIPVSLVEAALSSRLFATLADCGPIGDDECHYWDEIASFRVEGMSGGYFVADEEPAPQPWTHFGPHGPVFPVLYGGMARVLGWDVASGPVFNLLVLAAGMAAWLCLVRPDSRSLTVAVLIMLTFWPCLLYIPCTVQETLHYAIAFVIAGVAHKSLNEPDPDAHWFWPLLLAVGLASTLRITWALVLLAWAAVALPALRRRTRLVVSASIGLTIPCLLLLTRQIAGGYPNFVATVSDFARRDPLMAAGTAASHVGLSLSQLFSISDQRTDLPLEILQRFEALLLIFLAGFAFGVRVGGFRFKSKFFKFVQYTAVFAVLVFLAQDVVGSTVLTLAAGWQAWRSKKPLWPLLASAAGVGSLYVLYYETPLAIELTGETAVSLMPYGVIGLLVWLHRGRIADGIRLTSFLAPRAALPEGGDKMADGTLAIAPGARRSSPRHLAHRIRRALAVPPQVDIRPYLFAGLNLALTLVVVIVAYDLQYFRDYRVMAPHLLLSMLVLASGTGWRWAASVAALNLCLFPSFLTQFEQFHLQRVDRDHFAGSEIDLRPYLTYDPTASPWSNTVLAPDVKLANRLRVSPGIGVSWGVQFFAGGSKPPVPTHSPYVNYVHRFSESWLSRATRSRYLFASPKQARAWRGCQLRLLHEFTGGNLYLNLDFADGQDSGCTCDSSSETKHSSPP